MAYKIQSIQALRGIAAMLVVLGHMNVYQIAYQTKITNHETIVHGGSQGCCA